MQNHSEITSKTKFGTRNVRKLTKTLTSDMSGPAKASPGGQVLDSKAGIYFSSQKLHLSFLLINLYIRV